MNNNRPIASVRTSGKARPGGDRGRGGLTMHGLSPGPLLFPDQPQFVYGLRAAMPIGNVMPVMFNLPLISIRVRVLRAPPHILYPAALSFVIVGGSCSSPNTDDIIIAALSAANADRAAQFRRVANGATMVMVRYQPVRGVLLRLAG